MNTVNSTSTPATAPRRSGRKQKSVADLERRARLLLEEDGEQLFNESDSSVDLHELSEQEDVVDSDFDREEQVLNSSTQAQTAEQEARLADRVRSKRGVVGRYVDPALRPKHHKKRARQTQTISPSSTGLDRSSLRKSTRVASEQAAERRAIKQRRKPRERKLEHVHIPTQEERLETAKMTEKENGESLKQLLRLEEEKKRVPAERKEVTGDKIGYEWKHGKSKISFTKGVSDDQIRSFLFNHEHDDDSDK